ncbi:hypothetical protein [Streptomyces sp. MAR4 CNX-425]|uniref:hypothetical protein n=1 Tax=Streptomyces sp. MAR4 CNX-425 TaxID=3406343 RepID=UPI003B5018D7
MDELKVLRDWDAGTRPPRETARRAAREKLLAEARAAAPEADRARAPGTEPPRIRLAPVRLRGPGAGGPSRRTVVRSLVAAGATAAAVGAPLALLERRDGGGAGPAADLPPAGVLRAAARLERERESMRPPLEPGPGQYVYSRVDVLEAPDDPAGAVARYTQEAWLAADPSRRSWRGANHDPNGWWQTTPQSWPPADWRTLARIPREPEAMLTHFSSFRRGRTPDEFETHDWKYAAGYLIELIAWLPVLPDGLLPAALETFAEFPDKDVLTGTMDTQGRDALGLGLDDEPGSGKLLLFAVGTHEYLGVQQPRIRGGNPENGSTETTSLNTYAVVDEVKQRP